ncbi:hypothetical protein HD554DRAFT_811538 [Boletus coccyginus]|nr:hypothetical protein HD554DRAFT_811538 [Boletus coccyginus]
MPPLDTLPLPLPPNGPPSGYVAHDCDSSVSSRTTAFNTGINARDTFLGVPRCIICGESTRSLLQHCHISMRAEPDIWADLKSRNWVPPHAKLSPDHEPRNGLLMCVNHHIQFDHYYFFIRYFPDICKFVLVNYSGIESLQPYHGKAVALDVDDLHAPYPSLFIIHEMRVCGFHPFQLVRPDLPNDIPWQDWIVSKDVFDHDKGTFCRKGTSNPRVAGSQVHGLSMTPITGDDAAGSGKRLVAVDADVIGKILKATHAMPSWKAAEVEGMSWGGTAQENTDKYISCIGVED